MSTTTAFAAGMRSGSRVSQVDAAALAQELRGKIEGEVRFDDGSRALYSTDASNYRQIPIGVVIPRTTEDVVETIAVCRRFGSPVLSRGGGTSLAGQCCNVAVVIDFSKYLDQLIELDPERRRARVQPGIILDDLRSAARKHDLTFGPDPATHSHCVLGGMIGNNSCGIHSLMAGKTDDNIEELEILTYDGLRMRVGATSEEELQQITRQGGRRGEIYARLRALRDRYADLIRDRYPKIPRRVSGYNLDHLLPEQGFHVARALVGTEGTCVTVLEATGRLVYNPPYRSLLVAGYPDVYEAADHVPELRQFEPLGMEGLDERLVEYIHKKGLHVEYAQLLPEGGGWLLVEFGGDTQEEASERASRARAHLGKQSNRPQIAQFDDAEDQHRLWQVRESGLGATAFVPGEHDTWPGWEDSAVHPDRLGNYLRDLRSMFRRYGFNPALYGHFGQGCVHTRIEFDLGSAEGLKKYRAFVEEAADLVVSYGGSLSGEHGDGQARGELLAKLYGEELIEAFREFKAIWDPLGKMNPGKVVDPNPLDADLRLGVDYSRPELTTYFQYPDDEGSFSRATLRCVGVGKCRRESGGTMCPSYMVTREEKHTTRGRANTLFEMLEGEVIRDGWQSEEVKEALHLCLACKGCKSDCPVNVDMATYKAEFMAHYHEHKWRPRSAWSMGFINVWAQLASLAPSVANFVAGAPVLSDMVKWAGGIAAQRKLPKFASHTFRSWYARREPRNRGQTSVLLWPDTFTNHFHPQIGQAAVEVLESFGFQVIIPAEQLCCGRPLYDYGLLDHAKARLQGIVAELRPLIQCGVPMVGLEPSCVSVFRDELKNLLPHDEDARRLVKQTFLLSEFLNQRVDGDQFPELRHKALVHNHCHHKSVLGTKDETELLRKKLGMDVQVLDSGCCGMAGSFGFERDDRYEVSVACGERVLLPAVRNASADTLIVTDGFSCQEQIAQGTERRALHVAEVVRMALQESGQLQDRHAMRSSRRAATLRPVAVPALTAAAAVGLLAGWAYERRRA